VTLSIVNIKNCKQCLWVKRRNLKQALKQRKQTNSRLKWINHITTCDNYKLKITSFPNNCFHWNFTSNWGHLSLSKATNPFNLKQHVVWVGASAECVRKTAFAALTIKLQRAPLKTLWSEANDIASTLVAKKVKTRTAQKLAKIIHAGKNHVWILICSSSWWYHLSSPLPIEWKLDCSENVTNFIYDAMCNNEWCHDKVIWSLSFLQSGLFQLLRCFNHIVKILFTVGPTYFSCHITQVATKIPIVCPCQVLGHKERFNSVIICETCGTIYLLRFPWQPQSAQCLHSPDVLLFCLA